MQLKKKKEKEPGGGEDSPQIVPAASGAGAESPLVLALIVACVGSQDEALTHLKVPPPNSPYAAHRGIPRPPLLLGRDYFFSWFSKEKKCI